MCWNDMEKWCLPSGSKRNKASWSLWAKQKIPNDSYMVVLPGQNRVEPCFRTFFVRKRFYMILEAYEALWNNAKI